MALAQYLAELEAFVSEGRADFAAASDAEALEAARVKFLGLNLDFSIDKAKRELGYRPRSSFDQGMRETLAWYKQNAA